MPTRLVRIAFTPSGFAERSKVCAELPNQGDKFFDETLEVDIPPLDYPASAGGVGGTMRDAGDDGPDFPRQVGMLADVERVGDPLPDPRPPSQRVPGRAQRRKQRGPAHPVELVPVRRRHSSIAWEAAGSAAPSGRYVGGHAGARRIRIRKPPHHRPSARLRRNRRRWVKWPINF
ncbi:hypothetical protein V3I01_06775 [Sphingomonas sp. gentR]|jgi:hypothetical protein|uniref:hypothetical protein n=1 Tax=unclassified Sphingomonas TaxID=196159 RepID=UPI0012EB74DA|nr:hypothetical protein [Sphingomonas sp. LK11]